MTFRKNPVSFSVPRSLSPLLILVGIFTFGDLQAQAEPDEPVITLEEVVVRARRLEERLEDIPVSVSVFTTIDLERSRSLDLRDLTRLAPNVQFEGASAVSGVIGAPTVFIRGIGQTDFIVTSDPAVGIYIDDVYIPRMVGGLYELANVESVEVVRGPQGVIWGRNTIGGALSIHSEKIKNENALKLLLETGGQGLIRTKISKEFSLNEQWAMRVSGYYRHQNGYVNLLLHDDLQVGEMETLGGRAVVDWSPVENTSFTFSLYHGAENGNAAAYRALDLNSQAALVNFTNQSLVARGFSECGTEQGVQTSPTCIGAAQLTLDPYEQNQTFFDESGNLSEPDSSIAASGASLKFDWRTDAFSLRYIGAFHRLESDFQNSLTWGPALVGQNNNRVYDSDSWSHELRLSGDMLAGRAQWTVGTYGFWEDAQERVQWLTNHPLFTIPPSNEQFFDNREADNRSLALYGHVIWQLGRRWELTTGLRVTRETKRFSLTPNTVTAPAIAPILGKTETTETDPLVSLSYKPREGLMAYWTYSEGFRSGGFPPRLLTPPSDTFEFPAFGPEYVDNHELGLKTVIRSGNKLSMGMQFSAFQADYSDKQENAIPLNASGLDSTNAIQNIGDARIRGIEMQLQASTSSGFGVALNIAYLDASWKRIIGGSARGVNGKEIKLDNELPYAPDWSGSLSLHYNVGLRQPDDTEIHVDLSYTGDQHFRPENIAGVEQKAYSLVNANIQHALGRGWKARLGVNNVFNKSFATAGSVNAQSHGLTFVNVSRPRYFYISASYYFGHE